MGMWKYYWSLACEVPSLWKSAKAKRTVVIAALPLLAYLSPLLPQSWAFSVMEYWQALPHWLPVVPLVALVLYGLLKLNYDRYAAVEKRAVEREQELAKLQTAKFELVFGVGPPFEQEDKYPGSNEVQNRHFRVGVKNTGYMTVDDVVVRIVELWDMAIVESWDMAYVPSAKSPVPPEVLKLADDNPQRPAPYRRSFTLYQTGTPQFIDVVLKPEADLTAETDDIILRYATWERPNTISPHRHELLIEVAGRNAPSVNRWFIVDVDSEGHLVFGPKEATHS